MIEITEAGEPLTEADIASFERILGFSLPKDYRDFLLEHNGGKPFPYWFSYLDENGKEDRDGVGHLYGLGFSNPDYRNLQKTRDCFSGRIPFELLAVGDDPCGNQICVATQGKQFGQLFLWNHEDEHAPPTYRNVIPLANSFTEFISALHEVQHDWETPIDIAIQKNDVAELEKLLAEGVDLEATDQFGRTMLENAAIQNAIHVFEWLYMHGAQLKDSLRYAEENLRFFPKAEPNHERMVRLIRHLMQKQ